MILKKFIFIVFILVSSICTLSAQKNEVVNNNSVEVKTNYYKTILLSAAIPNAPFGIKYFYCKNFGAYVSFKSDLGLIWDDTMLTSGGTYAISEKLNCYVGAGYNFPWETIITEAGIVLKKNKFAFDLGAGFQPEFAEFYASLGIGFNF